MKVAKIILALIVLLATVASAFAGTAWSWTGYGPGLTGGYNVVSVQDGNIRYGVSTTYDTINGGVSECNRGRCNTATFGMRRDTYNVYDDGYRTYGDWYVTDMGVNYPDFQGHVFRGTDGNYHGSVYAGQTNGFRTYYAPSYYYPAWTAQPSVYAHPDYYGSGYY